MCLCGRADSTFRLSTIVHCAAALLLSAPLEGSGSQTLSLASSSPALPPVLTPLPTLLRCAGACASRSGRCYALSRHLGFALACPEACVACLSTAFLTHTRRLEALRSSDNPKLLHRAFVSSPRVPPFRS